MVRYLTLQKIIEMKSFTKAAEALGYTQSSVSQMIASLENELSMKLLVRSRTGVRLTLEGKELYPFIERTILQYRAMQEWIKTGLVDFGFITPAAVTGLETVKIKDGEMLAVLPKNHPLAENTAVPLDSLTGEPFILLEEGHYSEPLKAFHAAGLEPNIKYTVHDDFAIMTMVEAGLGVGILAKLMLRRTNYDIACLPTDPPIYRELAIGFKDKEAKNREK